MKYLFVAVFLISLANVFSQTNSWRVGSASNFITPLVNGNLDYFKETPTSDHWGPGTPVAKFDVGLIKVGNGKFPASWVRDHLNVTVTTIRYSPQQVLIVIALNVYMIFK